jgi:hypothetical protein
MLRFRKNLKKRNREKFGVVDWVQLLCWCVEISYREEGGALVGIGRFDAHGREPWLED